MAANKLKDRQFHIASEHCVGCLECQLRCSMVHHRVFNPDLANLRVVPSSNGASYYDIEYLDTCLKCGSCVRACIFDTLSMSLAEAQQLPASQAP